MAAQLVALTVRGGRNSGGVLAGRPTSGGGYGTWARPVGVTLDLARVAPAPIELSPLLGFEAIPATQVYGFSAPRRFELRLRRASGDRYSRHIQVTVLDATSRQLRYALTTASGEGEWAVLPAGEYRLVAALGIPEQVELQLSLEARPARVRLGPAVAAGGGSGLARRAPRQRWIASGSGGATGGLAQAVLQGAAGASGTGLATALVVSGAAGRCTARSSGSGEGRGRLAPMVWVDGYGRPMGPGINLPGTELEDLAFVRHSPWSLAVRLVDPATGAGRDLSGLSWSAEVWDLQRTIHYATGVVSVESPLAGGPVWVELSDEQTAAIGRYDGEPVFFSLAASDGTDALAYLLEGEGPLWFGYTR